MSEKSSDKCTQPELRPEHGKCSAEQIQKCHGSKEEHPCNSEKNK